MAGWNASLKWASLAALLSVGYAQQAPSPAPGSDVFSTQGARDDRRKYVSKDGLLQGPSLDLYRNITEKFPGLYFIASGGVSVIKDVDQLEAIGWKGGIIGQAVYEGRITLEELTKIKLVKK
ncbi:hypothetical protein B4Q13_24915 [Lacticaseibacillus rhamnosus]